MSNRIRDLIERLKNFEAGRTAVIQSGLSMGLNKALRDASTEFMRPAASGTSNPFSANVQRLGETDFDPPNPPPGPLKIRSGELRRSLYKFVKMGSGGRIRGGIGAKSPYAAIHELGGTTSPHVIRPVNAKMLRFMGSDGNLRFASMVNHPGSSIPARPYLRPALEKNSSYIVGIVRMKILDLLRNGVR